MLFLPTPRSSINPEKACRAAHFIIEIQPLPYFGGITLANIKSAEKKARQAVVRNARNQKIKSTVRTAEKALRTAAAAADKTKVPELFKTFSARMMSAAQKGVIHRSTASRKISRMATFLKLK